MRCTIFESLRSRGRKQLLLRLWCGLALLAFVAGCSRPNAAGTKSQGAAGKPQAAADDDETVPDALPNDASEVVKDPRTKWIGDVPYDVFYDNPLGEYRDGTPLVAASGAATDTPPEMENPETTPGETVATTETPTPEPTTDAAPTDAAAGGAVAWDGVAPIDTLVEETKTLRAEMTGFLQSLATFNANRDSLGNDGAILSAIAAVVERHPGAVNWKDKAPHIRTLASDLATSATSGTGRGPYDKTKESFEQITTMLDGGPAADVEAEANPAWGDTLDRSGLMKRLDKTHTWMTSNINTEARMKEEKDTIVREATVMATLAEVLRDSTFDFSDEPEYQQFLKEIVEASGEISAAAAAADFARLEAGNNRVKATCGPCHLKYKNE